ncbi:hypothetical protein, partial [Nocardia cyriacigeorgica]|uniref:hypothetical protein n=1 Tax=Nocardia cyriacigeorgica TaxID=135487 RepID=UPI00245468F7
MSGDIGSADAVTPDRVNVSAVLTTAQRPAWTKFGFICGRRGPAAGPPRTTKIKQRKTKKKVYKRKTAQTTPNTS